MSSSDNDFILHVNHLATQSSYAALARRWGFDEAFVRRVAKHQQEPSAHFVEVALAADPYPASMRQAAVAGAAGSQRAAGKGATRSVEVQDFLVGLREFKRIRIRATEQGIAAAHKVRETDKLILSPSYQWIRELLLRMHGEAIPGLHEVLLPPPTGGDAAIVADALYELQCLHDFCLQEAERVKPLDAGRIALDLTNFAGTCTTSIRQIQQALSA